MKSEVSDLEQQNFHFEQCMCLLLKFHDKHVIVNRLLSNSKGSVGAPPTVAAQLPPQKDRVMSALGRPQGIGAKESLLSSGKGLPSAYEESIERNVVG